MNPKPLRFSGGCCGSKPNAPPPPSTETASEQDTFQPNQDKATQPASQASCHSNNRQTKDIGVQVVPNQVCSDPEEPAPASKEPLSDTKPEPKQAEPKKSIWQKASDWFKQFFDILFIDLEALFTGPKKKDPKSSCSSTTEPKDSQQATLPEQDHHNKNHSCCAQ